jgi:hypothetical protein
MRRKYQRRPSNGSILTARPVIPGPHGSTLRAVRIESYRFQLLNLQGLCVGRNSGALLLKGASADGPNLRIRERVVIVGITQIQAGEVLLDDDVQAAMPAEIDR